MKNDVLIEREAARVLRKISFRLLPLLLLGYGFAFMDRVCVSFAALEMNRELHFSDAVYGIGAGAFFLGYALCEIPSNLALHYVGTRRWLARIMISWGLATMLMMVVRTPLQFYGLRFALGVAEAGFFPGVLLYLTKWFPEHRRAGPISLFYLAIPLSSIVMGASAGPLLGLKGWFGLSGWQWLFLVNGLPVVILGLCFLFLLPDSFNEARWLTEEERVGLRQTLGSNGFSGKSGQSPVFLVFGNRRVWQLGISFLLLLGSAYAFVFSAPDMLKQKTGLNISSVGLIMAAFNALGAIAMVLNAKSSDRTGERCWHLVVPGVVMGLSFLITGFARSKTGFIAGLACVSIAFYSIQGPFYSAATGLFRGRQKAVSIAAINTIASVGGFIGPYCIGMARKSLVSYSAILKIMALPPHYLRPDHIVDQGARSERGLAAYVASSSANAAY